MKLFEHTTWSDWTHFLGTDGKIDFEKYKDFIIKKEGLHSPILKLLTEQQTAWPTIQNFVAGPLGIGAAYIAGKMKFNPHEKFEVAIEELKRETDDVAESYDKKDQAQIKPQLNTILSTMEHNQDPQYALLKDNLYEVERELNILHTKHPQARPITIEYDNTNKKIRINTYKQSNFLTFNGTEVGITSPYNDTMWKTSNINEAIRIANLTNALTSSSYQFVKGSTEEQPYHISSFKDLEYLKQNPWDALKELNWKNLKDTSVLQDSIWSPRFEELYPSIEANKQAFAQWLNNFKYQGKSLWKKDS